uniref:Uncharacterized protein n=1 Tax=Tanacetum cinerariifolium TaxID=118510 RepID=A0A699I922_TANCI|nr:hypothetical protein [Tanacetum cinerariifolium]
MDPYNHSTPISIKLVILDTGKFEQWKFRIEQYLQHEHYALWEFIELVTLKLHQKRLPKIKDQQVILLESADHQGIKTEGKKKSYKKDPKVEEPAPKAMIAIDGIGWDWSYMAKEDEASRNYALVADEEEVPTEYALMAKSSSSSDNEVYDDSFCSKSCRKNTENLNTKISKLNEELSDCETDLYNYKRDRLLGSQKLDKDMKGVGFNEYCNVLPPPAQVYSPPKKDLSWMVLPEFVNDTVADYTRPTPSIDVSKSVSKEQEER